MEKEIKKIKTMKKLIKNTTPYVGKMRLKLEKFPYYTGKDKLNKIHYDLGFTKLVSRITPNIIKGQGWEVDKEKIELINQNTGGIIGIYSFDENPDNVLYNSFLHKDGRYIGDIERGWWYYQNNFTVTNKHPHGVAEAWEFSETTGRVIIGYYGYTHRGGCLFEIGDKLFDSKCKATWDDVNFDMVKRYCKNNDIRIPKDIEDAKTYIKLNGSFSDDKLADYIPFNKKGIKIIETLEEAEQAAINLSKYLS